MRRSARLLLTTLMLGAAPGALAQTRDPLGGDTPLDEAGDEIIVTGAKQRGAVMGDVQPEQQLSAADVRALGVTSIAEIITELAPQTDGSQVVLLNGKRISSFSEISDLPSEAVARVDILPEQVALSYGYAPTQKVVNIVLRQRFRAETLDLRGGTTTDGGRENGRIDGGLLRIRRDNRMTFALRYDRAAQLLESQRGVLPAVSAAAGPEAAALLSRYRTLSPATENVSANATLARALGGVSATVNARVELSDNDALQGLPSAFLTVPSDNPFATSPADSRIFRYLAEAGALERGIRGTTGHLGITLDGQLMPKWQWSFTGNADISDTRTRTDRGIATGAIQAALDAGDPALNPLGPIPADLLSARRTDSARSLSRAVTGDLLLNGPLFALPAGDVMTSIRLGASATSFEGWSIRSGVETRRAFDRQIGSGQVSFDLPITSRRDDVLPALGDIGVNVNAAAQHLSDFGTLSTLGYGLRWKPVPAVQILMSASEDRAAPTGTQITDPLISTPNVSVFDYARGETVAVTQLSGGNPNLRESVRDQFRLSINAKPFRKPNLTLTATYINSRTTNAIAAFPAPTPAIEAAFPQRFLRDASGALLQIDGRPINFASARSERLRWGFDLSIPLKSRIQKVVEAWRAAGAKPEERPKELGDLRSLFGGGRGRRGGGADAAPGPEGGDRTEEGARGEGRSGGRGYGGRGGGGFGGGGFGGGGRGGGAGRLVFSLHHTWHLTEDILIAPGAPRLDLLDGDATGSSGGQPRHEVEARVGYTNNGFGARLGVDWESGTRVDGALTGTGTGPSRLDFGSLATVDLRLFANLGQMPALVKDHPFLRGSRLSIGIDNLFNTRRDVTDATGATPLRYQPGYLDPRGRAITISFRKLFSPPRGGRR